MAYEIQTKDGIIIRNIPDDVAPDSDALKRRVAQERARVAGAMALEGEGALSRFAIGAGKAIGDIGLGAKQLGAEALNAISPRLVSDQTVSGIQQQVDEARARDEAVLDSGWGLAGNITGNVALAALPGAGIQALGKAAQLPGMIAAGRALLSSPASLQGLLTQAGYGGILSALEPVSSEGNRVGNVALGVVAGGAVPALGMAGKAGKAMIQPLYAGGREQVIGKALRSRITDPDAVAQQLARARSLVPGSVPTAAEVTDSGGLAAMQRAAAAVDPDAYARRGMEQNAARYQALADIAGTDAQRAAAVTAREAATNQLYNAARASDAVVDTSRVVNLIDRMIAADPKRTSLIDKLSGARNLLFDEYAPAARGRDAWQELTNMLRSMPRMSSADYDALGAARRVMDRMKKGGIDAAEALQQLRPIKATSKTATDMLDRVKQYVNTPDFVVTDNVNALRSASKQVGDMMQAQPGAGALPDEVVARLRTLKKALDHQISKAEPAYGQAMRTYAAMSEPINRMDVGRELIKRSTTGAVDANGVPIVYAGKLNTALKSPDQVAAAGTGFRRAKMGRVMSPSEQATIAAVQRDLQRLQHAQSAGRGVGSDTVQKLAMTNIMAQAGLPMSVLNAPGVGRLGNWAYSTTDELMQRELAKILLDPARAAQVIRAAAPSTRGQALGLLGRTVLPPLAIGTGLAVRQP